MIVGSISASRCVTLRNILTRYIRPCFAKREIALVGAKLCSAIGIANETSRLTYCQPFGPLPGRFSPAGGKAAVRSTRGGPDLARSLLDDQTRLRFAPRREHVEQWF